VEFLDLRYFGLLAVPALLVGLYVAYWRWKRRAMARAGDPRLLEAMSQSRSARADVAAFVLVAVALGLLSTALAGPQWGEKKEEVRRRGIDVVFAIDISRSMKAEDVPPSRLAAARAEITRILSRLHGDRVGLVGFAGIAYAQCPLTTDYSAVRTFLDLLDPEAMPVQGTAIGRAITESVHLLTGERGPRPTRAGEGGEPGGAAEGDGDQRRDMRRGRDQLIVLFTDGEDHETRPEDAAAEAFRRGIRVFAVPIGTPDGGEIPIYGRDGRRVRSLTDRRGEVVISRVQEEALLGVVEAGGGLLIPYRGEGSVAGRLAQEIERMQAEEIDEILRPEREERFYFFVAPALLLVLIAMALTDRKRGAPHVGWLGAVALALAVPGLGGCEETFVYEAGPVREGLAESRAGQTAEGLERIRGFRDEIAPEDLLDRRALDYNEALALLRDGQTSEARALLLKALGSDDPEVQLRSQFNLGNLAFQEGDYREALARYRRALLVRPDDEDSKWNLEVTLRRLFPACSAFEDAFEENDRPEEASPLELPVDPSAPPPAEGDGAAPKRVLCGGDPDFYRIEDAFEGAHVNVRVELQRLREDTGGAALPDFIRPESVRVTLYAGDGSTVLDTDTGEDQLREGQTGVRARQLTRELRRVAVPPGAAPSGVLYLEVDADIGLEYEYDLEVSVWPPCAASEDRMEDNDTPEQAAPLEPGDHPLHICPGDDDWFRIRVEPGDSVFVDLQPGPDQSPEALETQAAAGGQGSEHTVALRAELWLPGASEPHDVTWGRDGMLELEARDIETAGEVLIRVSGMLPDGQGPYLAQVYTFAPCIVGDDRFEDNDTPESATPLDPSQGPQRHLRICDGDDDWFRVNLTQDQHFSVSVAWAEPNRRLTLAMLAPPDGTVLAYGTPSEAPVAPARAPDELSPPPPRARYQRSIHVEEPETTGPHLLRVAGEPGFYHLDFPNPNEDPSCDNPQESEDPQDPQDDPQDPQDDGQDSQDPQDQSQDPQDSQQDSQAQDSQQQPDDRQQEPQERDRDPGEAEAEVDRESERAEAERSEEEAARERLRQLLESLAAEQDRNLQLERARENIEPIQVERQW
jgi:Ca-activated chloride channel homolog